MLRHLLIFLLVACNSPATDTAAAADTSGPVVLHTLNPVADGWAVRGALTELGGRYYGLAGEGGPRGVARCSSGALWNSPEHTQHCPGAIFSLLSDGSDFRVDAAFAPLDDRGRGGPYHPYGTLVAGPAPGDGHPVLYGVTRDGGTAPGALPELPPGFGTLFMFDPVSGQATTLWEFFGFSRARDGEYPMGTPAIVPDAAGGLAAVCGTAKGGGGGEVGTAWCWRPGASASDALAHVDLPGESYGGLVYAPARAGGGLLHGTTWAPGAGVYFTVDPTTMALRIVASFPAYPWPAHGNDNTPIQAPLVLASGEIVAAREFGGAAGTGLIALLTPSGIWALHESDDIPLDAVPRFANATGAMPNGQLAEAPDGAIYGTMQYGGAAGTGAIYRIARGSARVELVWSWPNAAYPYGGVTLGSDGALYGVTFDTGEIWRWGGIVPRAGGVARGVQGGSP